jgi:sugar/nucleoside kinase (ribokinase family)
MVTQLIRETTPIGELPEARLRAITRYANAAGALTCTKPGVIPSLPTRAEVEGFVGGW